MAYGLRRKIGKSTRSELWGLGDRLENFTPIRYTSLYGTSTMTPDGYSFKATPEFAARQREVGDFWGAANRNLLEYNQGDASERTLALLRRRRAEQFNPQVSAMESRLIQQGRLGLGTGASGANPEMAGLFSAEAMADLEAQLIAEQESRNQGAYLFDMAAGARGMYDSVADPNQAGLFNTAGFIQNNRMNAMGLRAQGTMSLFNARMAGADDLHEFGMTAWQGFTNAWSGNMQQGGGGMGSQPSQSGGGGSGGGQGASWQDWAGGYINQ